MIEEKIGGYDGVVTLCERCAWRISRREGIAAPFYIPITAPKSRQTHHCPIIDPVPVRLIVGDTVVGFVDCLTGLRGTWIQQDDTRRHWRSVIDFL